MNCANHPQTVAAAFCRTCGKPLCPACQRNVQGVIYCQECVERLGAVPPPPGQAGQVVMEPALGIPPGAKVANMPSPGLAALLGFIPGVGAIYNGQFVKGVAHVAIFIALIVAANNLPDNVSWIPGLGIGIWIFYMVYDAYQTARARELGRPLPDPFGFESLWEGGRKAYSVNAPAAVPGAAAPVGFAPAAGTVPAASIPAVEPPPSRAAAAPIGAIVLIALGALFLLSNLANFPMYWISRYWFPAALIALGIWIYVRKRSRPGACGCAQCQARCAMGPAILVTVGALQLLDNTTHWYWDRSWPILLIVIGAVLVIRHGASSEGHVDDRLGCRSARFQDRMETFQERMNDKFPKQEYAAEPAPPQPGGEGEVHHG
ncbi:MAG: B-box zinc finger protein [Acidobacteria bacterium]|nr:B-box zinc finger protein [Acidobacteriota bacterium]